MEIHCPTGGTGTLVMNNTICVRGIVTAAENAEKDAAAAVIRVRVVAGWVIPAPLPPEPMLPGDVDVTPAGQDWCAQNVPVPGSSPTGVQLTAIAWRRGSPIVPWGAPHSVWFLGGGPTPVDCCAACGG